MIGLLIAIVYLAPMPVSYFTSPPPVLIQITSDEQSTITTDVAWPDCGYCHTTITTPKGQWGMM